MSCGAHVVGNMSCGHVVGAEDHVVGNVFGACRGEHVVGNMYVSWGTTYVVEYVVGANCTCRG